MTSAPDPAGEQLDLLRALVTSATQRLLGDTISVTDQDWRGASRLPEWSRGHVATHLARHADALSRLAEWARTGERQSMYASPEQRAREIEEGADRSGLDLQIDLDTSAGRLGEAFEALEQAGRWDEEVEMRGGLVVPARLLPLSRLLEVAIHHVDLGIGYEITDIDETTSQWLLEWSAFRMRDRDDFPRLSLIADGGVTVELGSVGEAIPVRGSSAKLLGWVTNRLDASAVRGADGLRLPAF